MSVEPKRLTAPRQHIASPKKQKGGPKGPPLPITRALAERLE